MKAKITFPLLAFFIFVNNKYSQFDVSESSTDLVQIMLLQSQKIISNYQYKASLRATSKNIDSNPLWVESLIKTIQPSIHKTTLRCEFFNLQSPHFLTI